MLDANHRRIVETACMMVQAAINYADQMLSEEKIVKQAISLSLEDDELWIQLEDEQGIIQLRFAFIDHKVIKVKVN